MTCEPEYVYDGHIFDDVGSKTIKEVCDASYANVLPSFSIPMDFPIKDRWLSLAQLPTTLPYLNDIETIPKLIEKQALERPGAQAIDAWDRTLTYQELNAEAGRLARYLVDEHQVQRGDLIPVCFEKSAWHFVAVLAINKAGAAWVPLEPDYPSERMRQIIRQTGCKLILTSGNEKCAELGVPLLHIAEPLIQQLPDEPLDITVAPEDAMYVLFTSGSTGTPKGLVMEHRSVAISQISISARLGMHQDVRALQFASFVFDLSILEIFAALINGACVCVPSGHDRLHNLTSFIKEHRVNWCFLTPSFVQTLSPDDIDLELLLLCGEACTQDILDKWFGRVRLCNGWGPAETCALSTIHEYASKDESPLTVGRPVGGCCWIVNPDDHTRLSPMFTEGELVIQGPTILREYLGDPVKTKAAIVPAPAWAPGGDKWPWNRFFKSGDLGRFNSDGTIEFASRKDTQVKIRGLRVELGEVEHHVRSNLPVQRVAVEVLHGRSGSSLICFFSYTSEDGMQDDDPTMPMTDDVRAELTVLVGKMRRSVPLYMIPSTWVPMKWMPVITSTKLNRSKLRAIASSLDASSYSLQDTEKRPAETDVQKQVLKLWAIVLNKREDTIGIDDNFYHIGGDSIRVITLAKQIEKEFGVNLVKSLINTEHATIADMALKIDVGEMGLEDAAQESNMDLMAQIDETLGLLGSLMSLQGHPQSTLPDQATVFLTGATGYLGGEMLRHLVRHDRIKTVVTHVRASSPEQGLQRLIRTAEIGGWWHEDSSKIEVWTGDLSQPHMGLNDSQWARLATMDAFIHNGAVVNWNANYEALRIANVQSTVDLLELTMMSTHAKFVFISGGVKIDTQEDKAAIAEVLAPLTGYAQTKFVAETIINEVARQLPLNQNRISTIKPGRIIGTAEEGTANVDDYTWRIVGTAIAMGVYPLGDFEPWLYTQCIDWISSLTIDKLLTPDGVISFDDLNLGLPTSRFWDLIKSELAESLEPLSWDDWTERAMALANKVGEKHPLYAIQNFLGQLGWPEAPTNERTWDGIATMRLEEAVTASIRYLVDVGYVELCKGGDVELKGVMQRSTAVHI